MNRVLQVNKKREHLPPCMGIPMGIAPMGIAPMGIGIAEYEGRADICMKSIGGMQERERRKNKQISATVHDANIHDAGLGLPANVRESQMLLPPSRFNLPL